MMRSWLVNGFSRRALYSHHIHIYTCYDCMLMNDGDMHKAIQKLSVFAHRLNGYIYSRSEESNCPQNLTQYSTQTVTLRITPFE